MIHYYKKIISQDHKIKWFLLFFGIFLVSILGMLIFTNYTYAISGGSGDVVRLQSPINFENPTELIAAAIRLIMSILGLAAVAALIYGAVLYLTSGGNEEQAGKGKKVVTYAILGLIVSILSYVIVNTLIRAIGG